MNVLASGETQGKRIRIEGHIYDGDGNAILDGMAGLWCVNVGYGRDELVRAAAEQMTELPFYNTFFKTATPPTVMLAAKLAEKLGGKLQDLVIDEAIVEIAVLAPARSTTAPAVRIGDEDLRRV